MAKKSLQADKNRVLGKDYCKFFFLNSEPISLTNSLNKPFSSICLPLSFRSLNKIFMSFVFPSSALS